VLNPINPLQRARQGRQIAENRLSKEDSRYLTTFHYAPALSGFLADRTWVLDVYDDPMQYVYNNPRSLHSVSARVLLQLLDRADRAVHTIHPATSRTFTDDRRFAINGAPTSVLNGDVTTTEGPLQVVFASSREASVSLLLEAVQEIRSVEVDIYCELSREAQALVDEVGGVKTHGWQPHDTVIKTVELADIGFCVLPKRPDWYYSYPLRVGECLAGGTVPIVSDFPGSRDLVRSFGCTVNPAV